MYWLWLDDDDYDNNVDDGNNIVVTGLTISANKIYRDRSSDTFSPEKLSY
jgi:hypothetical protein